MPPPRKCQALPFQYTIAYGTYMDCHVRHVIGRVVTQIG